MNCQIRLTCFSFRPYLKVGQGSLESRSVQNNLAFYPPSLHRIQTKKQPAFRRRKWKKIPYPITMKLFYEQACRLQILPQQYSVLSLLFLRCSAPPFCFLRMSRPLTLLHCHPSAVPQFFTFLSPFPISLFTCLRNRIPLPVFMLSYSRKVSKQCV